YSYFPVTSADLLILTPPHSFRPFLFNLTPTTEIYTLSLHDALPISGPPLGGCGSATGPGGLNHCSSSLRAPNGPRLSCGALKKRSEEHTSELQSRVDLVCRLLLEKKKKKKNRHRED